MSVLRSSLALSLTVAMSLSGPAPVQAAQPTQSSSDRAKFLKAQLDGIDTSVSLCNENPSRGAEFLGRNLSSLHGFAPEIAAKPELQNIQRRSVLALARAYHNSGQSSRARATLNALYRTDPPRTTELRAFGPSLSSLGEAVRNKVASLGRGRIEVECTAPCQVFINERSADKSSSHLEGEYRVYVQDAADEKPPLRKHVEIHRGGGDVTIRYDNRLPNSKASLSNPNGDPLVFVDPSNTNRHRDNLARPHRTSPNRIAPKWLEITGLVVGIAGAGTGGVLIGIHDQTQPRSVGKETELKYETKIAGIIFAAAGGAVALTSAILLAIDQRNVNRKRPSKLSQRRWLHPLHLRF